MSNIANILISIAWSSEFLLLIISLSCIVKLYFLAIIIHKGFSIQKLYHPWTFTIGILIGSLFGDFAWIIKAFQHLWLPSLPYRYITFFIRIAWGFVVIQYQSLALLLQSLLEKNFRPSHVQKMLFLLSGSFSCYFFYLAFFEHRLTGEAEREAAKLLTANIPLEFRMIRYTVLYLLNLLIIPSIYNTFTKTHAQQLPKILRTQLTIFIRYLVCPYVMTEFIQTSYLVFTPLQPYIIPAVSCATILLIYTTYYCMHKILCLRFLTHETEDVSTVQLTTLHTLKSSIDALGQTVSTHELNHIVQFFFHETYHIPTRAVALYIRHNEAITHPLSTREQDVEHFLNTCTTENSIFIEQSKILNFDEIIYDQFYNPSPTFEPIISFLITIDSDIFIPIYNKRKLVAYILVKRDARDTHYYTRTERDEMLLFTSYLSNIISLLHNHNLEKILQHAKYMQDELYTKNQEINLYKEGIRTCVKNKIESPPGVIFYHNRRFFMGNHRARTLLPINLNEQAGHPITKILKKIAFEVLLYKIPQTSFIDTDAGTRLLINATPYLEKKTVIITVAYPDITDIVLTATDHLDNNIAWEHIVYLETTHAGTLLNKFLPSTSHTMLSLKLDLLSKSMCNTPIAIHAHEDDSRIISELLHAISKREKWCSISVNPQSNMRDLGIKLFGINQIIDKNEYERPLLETLDSIGTLIINNIDLFDHTMQQHIADFIRSGVYSPLKSEQRLTSNTRIIGTTTQSLHTLHEKGILIPQLYMQLAKHTISMPNMTELPHIELTMLIDGLWQQLLATQPFHHLLKLPEQDKLKLIQKNCTSLYELKMKIQQLFSEKIRKMVSPQSPHTQINAIQITNEQHIVKIAALGKHALKDQKLMTTLWRTFKNQNKIATLLNVNRSSVNRRCKEYNLL